MTSGTHVKLKAILVDGTYAVLVHGTPRPEPETGVSDATFWCRVAASVEDGGLVNRISGKRAWDLQPFQP